LVFASGGAPKDANVACAVARRTSEYGFPPLAEPTAERSVRKAGWEIIQALYVKHEAVSRRVDESLECGD